MIKGKTNDLSYKLCSLDPDVRFLSYEYMPKSIVFHLQEKANHSLGLACNYTQNETFNTNGRKQLVPTILHVFVLSGKNGEKVVKEFPTELWFNMDFVSETFEFYIIDLETNLPFSSTHNIWLHVFYRKK